jgi:hypothetical protein
MPADQPVANTSIISNSSVLRKACYAVDPGCICLVQTVLGPRGWLWLVLLMCNPYGSPMSQHWEH